MIQRKRDDKYVLSDMEDLPGEQNQAQELLLSSIAST